MESDSAGRPIIDSDRFKTLPRERRGDYAIRVAHTAGAVRTIQASKLLKWQGLGYRLVEAEPSPAVKPPARRRR